MTPDELRKLLKQLKARPALIETEKGVSVSTVYNFLRGDPVNATTHIALIEWAESKGFKSLRKVAGG